MSTSNPARITVSVIVNAPVSKVWRVWTEPSHITQWNAASDDWHTPRAENDLRVGGGFLCRMEARDGTMGFDFRGSYDAVEEYQLISYVMEDGRRCTITFEEMGDTTTVTEAFEPESQHSHELQQGGWQAILNNFKQYTENTAK